MIGRKDFTASELRDILSDKLFSRVSGVGVNGGEPFLKYDLTECINVMLETLPKLKTFYFISNGFFTGKILSQLEIIKAMCVKQGVKLHVSFSVDGINEMQDFHRGHKDAFKNANETITRILQDKKRFLEGCKLMFADQYKNSFLTHKL